MQNKPIIYERESYYANYRDSSCMLASHLSTRWLFLHRSSSDQYTDGSFLSFCHLQIPNNTNRKNEYNDIQNNSENWYKHPIFQLLNSRTTKHIP